MMLYPGIDQPLENRNNKASTGDRDAPASNDRSSVRAISSSSRVSHDGWQDDEASMDPNSEGEDSDSPGCLIRVASALEIPPSMVQLARTRGC